MSGWDVAIVGLGAMGGAAAWELARRGVRVIGLDARSIPNEASSHHGGSRIIRLAYAEHPDYVPLLRRAFARWQELEQALGEHVLHLVGGLYMGPPDGPFLSGVGRAVEMHGLAHERLDSEALRRRYPTFAVPEGTVAILERQAGALMCERIVAGHARLAAMAGAELHGHAPVAGWRVEADRVVLDTAIGRIEADRLLLASGAWTGPLLSDLGLPLRTTRQVVGWFQPRRPSRFAPASMPVWGLESPDGGFVYGFPQLPDRPGVKMAHHVVGEPVDPDALDRDVRPDERTTFEDAMVRVLPEAAGPVLSLSACLYTNTPDGHFVVDHHPRHGRVVIAAGFSGHGFKFASVLGEALADLCTRGRTDLPIGFLGLDRPALRRDAGATVATD